MQCLEELRPHGLHNCCKSGMGVSGRVLIQAARLMEEGMFLKETLISPRHAFRERCMIDGRERVCHVEIMLCGAA